MRWIIAYLPPQLNDKTVLSNFEELINSNKSLPTLINGDLNARIGEFSNITANLLRISNLPLYSKRRSKDKTENVRGKWFKKMMLDNDLTPLNGTKKSDANGEITYVAAMGQ